MQVESANMTTSDGQWHIVYTRPRSEKKLAEALTKKQIMSYLPILRMQRKWSDRYKWVERPAFESYMFVLIREQAEFMQVLRLPHAVRFVEFGGELATLTQNDIDIIRISSELFAESLIIRDATLFSPGQKVRIKLGPFAGKEAIVERNQGKSLLLVSFPALNKTLQVEIPVENFASPGDPLL
jgi:transcription antitermination factor NusG